MSKTNTIYASERMLRNNPMGREEIRLKVSRALKEIGHKPRCQGGNGRGLTETQTLLLSRLQGPGWKAECVVKTGLGALGYPHHYKIDIANPDRKIAIEIDGPSHGSLKVQRADDRKTSWLRLNGWTVYRYTNREVLTNLEEIVNAVA